MKEKWETPRIVVEKFAPNDYISACYEVYCYTPENNSPGYVFKDSNGNGVWDKGDEQIGRSALIGDGVKEFTGTLPANNGFWVNVIDTRDVRPIFVFHKNEGSMDWHGSDLASHAYTDVSTQQHPNRS